MIVHGTPGKKTLCGYGFANDTEEQKCGKGLFCLVLWGMPEDRGDIGVLCKQGGNQPKATKQAKAKEEKKQRSRTHNTEKRKKTFSPSTSGTADGSTTYLLLQLLPHFYSAHNSRARTRWTAIGFWPRREREREAEEGAKGPSSP